MNIHEKKPTGPGPAEKKKTQKRILRSLQKEASRTTSSGSSRGGSACRYQEPPSDGKDRASQEPSQNALEGGRVIKLRKSLSPHKGEGNKKRTREDALLHF